MEDLKLTIQEWVHLDEALTETRQEMKKLALQKKKASDKLLALMKSNNIDNFELKGGDVRRKTVTTKSQLNKALLLSVLSKYYEDEQDAAKKAADMTMMLLSSRPIKTTDVLSRKPIK